MGKNLPKERTCIICGDKFMDPWPKKTCSLSCTSKLRSMRATEQFARARGGENSGECSVCGKPTKRVRDYTCSKECAAKRMSINAKGHTRNKWGGAWCVYTPPSAFDMQYMLDIMHRKGYTSGQDSRNEKYTYTITAEGNIEWWDLKPSRASHDWQTSFGQEQQGHRVCVEQETEEESAYQCTLKELRAGFKDWVASAEEAMGKEAPDWIF